MSENREILCDSCKKDLTYTNNCVDYRLVLSSQSKSPWFTKDGGTVGAVTAMHIEPPIKGDKHFCSLVCLREWLWEELN